MIMSRFVCTGLVLASLATTSLAQNGDPSQAPVAASRIDNPYIPAWSSPEIAVIARQLTGTWRTEQSIESMPDADGQSRPVYVVMTIAPAPVSGLSDTFYVETARTDSPWSPYRRAIFQIFPYKDGHRLRTYELAVGRNNQGVFNGMFAAPDFFPELSAEELIATIDLDITPTDTGFTGKSPYPFPTRVGGAVEMTSEIKLDGDVLSVADRGLDANGNTVWGGGQSGMFHFDRTQGVVSITRRDDGMVILDYGGASGPIVANGDQMHVHYEGFLANKHRFDASYDRGAPFVFPYPPGNRAIAGWGFGMDDFAEGARRKLIIPGALGYGPGGNPRANIPGNATLFFNVHLTRVDRTPPGANQNPEPN